MSVALDEEVLARDVHPAEVVMPGGSVLTGCRVFVTTARVLVFKATPDKRIELAAELELSEPRSVVASRNSLQGRLEIHTTEGTAWVNRGRGCGCGSILRAMGLPVSWTRGKR